MTGGNKMFICLDCGKVFEDPKHYTETHRLDTPPYEEWGGCPSCGGAYTEAYECSCCGEYIDGAYIKTKNGERICENCYITYELGDED